MGQMVLSTYVTVPVINVKLALRFVPLIIILALQSVVSLTLNNTAFQDEALYLYAGGEYFDYLLGGNQVAEPYALYFSGLPYLYPLIAGAVDAFGGLEAARHFSLMCTLIVTIAVYFVTRHFFDRNSALVACALYAVQGSVLFLGRLATYDAMCLALLAISTLLALKAGSSWKPLPTIALGIVLFFAVASKYAGLLYVPTVLAILCWQSLRTVGKWQTGLRLALAVLLVIEGILIVLVLDNDVLVGVRATTTERTALLQSARLALAERAALQGGLLTLLAFVGLIIGGLRRSPIAIILFGSALLAPAYHIYKMESFSMHKHIAYGLFFGAPLAGYAVARLSSFGRGERIGRRWVFGLASCMIMFGIGFQQAQGFYREWANSHDLMRVINTQVRPGSGRYLAEESEVMRYYLRDTVASWQWNQLYWFFYTDQEGRGLQGVDAYKAAIDEGYFDLIILRYGPAVTTAQAIDDGLEQGLRYELISQIPYYTVFGDGNYWVWRRRNDEEYRTAQAVAQANACPSGLCEESSPLG